MTKSVTQNWTFRKVRLKRIKNFPTEWMLVIENVNQLLDYLEKARPCQIEKMFTDEIHRNGKHFTDSRAYVADLRARSKGISWVQGLVELMDDVNTGMFRTLSKGFILYIRSIGSYSADTPENSSYEILEEQCSDKLIWPKSGVVSIKKFPQGRHWYATVDGIEVVVDGIRKWNTYSGAQAAVSKFTG